MKFLIIVDEPNDRKRTIQCIRDDFSDASFTEVFSEKQFYEALKEEYDAAITDYQLHWTNGIQVLMELKKRRPFMPVIMLTTTATEEVVVEALKRGLDDYVVTSPAHLARLPAAIKTSMENAEERRKRREAEELLKRSEARYHTLFESANDAIFLMEKETFVECNFKTIEMFGCEKKEDIVGHRPFDFSPERQPDGRFSEEKARELIRAALAGKPQRFYWRHLKRDGTPFDTEVSLNRLELEGKTYLQAIVRDVTEHREMEEKLRNFFETTEVGIWCFRPERPLDTHLSEEELISEALQSVCVECNDTYARMMGAKREELIGMKLSEVMPDVEENREYLRSFIRNGFRISGGVSYEINKKGEGKYFSNSMVGVIQEGKLVEAWGTQTDITGVKKLEESLKESEEKYRMVVEQSHDAIYIYRDNRFLFVNDRVCEITEYSKRELLSMNIWNLIHPEDRKRVQEIGKKRAQGKKVPSSYEARVVTKNGDIRYCEFAVASIVYEGKYAALGSVRDITERKRMEEEIRESEEKYRSLFESSPEAITIVGLDGTVLDCNTAAVQLSGLAKEHIIGRQFTELGLLREHDIPHLMELFHSEVDGERVDSTETELHIGGETKHIEVFPALLRRDGKAYAIQIIIRDITERKRAEEALQKSEEKYRTLIQDAVEGIYRTTIQGDILETNPALAHMLGYRKEEFEKLNATEIYRDPKIRERFVKKLQKYGTVKNFEVEYVGKNGNITAGRESARLTEGDIIEGIVHDVTEAKAYEKRLKAIAEISNSLIGEIHLDELYEKCIEEIINAFEADGGVIFELKRKYLHLKKSHGMSKEYRRKYKKVILGSTVNGKVAQTGKPVLITDSRRDRRATPDVVKSEGYRSAMVVPVVLEGKIVGSVGVLSRQPNHFSRDDMATLQSIANQIATAVNAAKLHRRMEHALQQEREFKMATAHYFFNPICIAKGFLELALEEDDGKDKIAKAIAAIGRVESVVKNVTQRGEIRE